MKRGDAATLRTHSVTRLMRLFAQIVDAIGYAHERGVVHRSLMPANVMFGEHGEVHVLDWNQAELLDRSDLERRSVDGEKPSGGRQRAEYTPPEELKCGQVDERGDIYALGAMLYELLTLKPPFTGLSQIELENAILSNKPLAPCDRSPERDIPIQLQEVCLKALAKKPPDRQQTAEELLAGVHEWFEESARRA